MNTFGWCTIRRAVVIYIQPSHMRRQGRERQWRSWVHNAKGRHTIVIEPVGVGVGGGVCAIEPQGCHDLTLSRSQQVNRPKDMILPKENVFCKTYPALAARKISLSDRDSGNSKTDVPVTNCILQIKKIFFCLFMNYAHTERKKEVRVNLTMTEKHASRLRKAAV